MPEYPVITHEGQEVPWTELRLEPRLANTDEDIDRNIEHALTLGLPTFQGILETEEGAVSIVGSGPSLKENWRKMVDSGHDIMACNAACQFLLERDIVPKYMFCFDADPLMLEFITARPDITYLMASRSPPKAFELLAGCKVVLWHAAGDKNINPILEKHHRLEPMISGGSAAVTRSMVLSVSLGYRSVHLWGCDSSFHNGATHIRQSTTKERQLQIMCNNRVFYCAPWMALQANDFKVLAPSLRSMGVRVVVHGDGLIPHLAKAMQFDTDGESRVTQIWRDVRHKAGILWSQL